MTAIVVGIGQRAAGDDGVGLEVARRLAERGVPARECADASLVLSLLGEGARVVVIDAVVGGGEPGVVLELDPTALAGGPSPISSHGLGVAEAVELARTLYGDRAVAGLRIVGVAIDRPGVRAVGLSRAVAASVDVAADLAASLALQELSDA